MGQQKVKDFSETPESAEKELSDANVKVSSGKGKKKQKRQVPTGRAYIQASYNNTIITLTDTNGNTLTQASAGMLGFKGPKKSTPYAAGIIVSKAIDNAKPYGLREVNVFVTGVGGGRESAIRALNANGLIISSIKDITPIPHNGCRPKKPRRV